MSDITVYTQKNCQQCKATFRKLNMLGVEYDRIDVSEDPDGLDYIKSLGYLQAPVIVLGDGSHWSGYRPALLQQLASGDAVGG